jgi:hypothetical protein
MKKVRPTDRHRLENLLLTSFLLVSVFFSLSGGLGARTRVSQTEGEPGPNSIRSPSVLSRTDALTTFKSRRTASDKSKQNRVKNPLRALDLVPGEFGARSATFRQRLVDDSQSVFYLTVRYSRPIGRAPPPSV